jgi:hypothetical protein
MRLRVRLGWTVEKLHVSVSAKLQDSEGNKELLDKAMGRYNCWSNVLDANMSHEKLRSSDDRLMPGGTLTICIEIKIFPSVAAVSHGDLQYHSAPVPLRAAAALATAPTSIFEDMVDDFVDMKLNSVLIVFKDGEQKCHAFPLVARNVSPVENILF